MKEKYIIVDESTVQNLINGPLLENGNAVGLWECGKSNIIICSDSKIMGGFSFKNHY